MFVIIIGAGKLGFYLAQLLLDEDHDAVLVDKNEQACETSANELDIVTINGDATKPDILEKAGVKEADAVVALTGNDETNMIISLLAKDLGAKQVAARIERVQYDEKVLKKLGIDIVIHPEAAAAGYIEELITKPEVLDLAFISRGQAEIIEILVKKESKIANKKVLEIEHPEGSAIVAIIDDNKLIIPDKKKKITPGMKILILAKTDVIKKAKESFL